MLSISKAGKSHNHTKHQRAHTHNLFGVRWCECTCTLNRRSKKQQYTLNMSSVALTQPHHESNTYECVHMCAITSVYAHRESETQWFCCTPFVYDISFSVSVCVCVMELDETIAIVNVPLYCICECETE